MYQVTLTFDVHAETLDDVQTAIGELVPNREHVSDNGARFVYVKYTTAWISSGAEPEGTSADTFQHEHLGPAWYGDEEEE